MGFDDGEILLDSDNGAYSGGDTVYGRMVFDQGKPKTIYGIYISFKGFCKVHWTTTETRRVNDRDITETIDHDSYEEYFNRKVYIYGSESGEHHLNSGHHEFRFDFPLPPHIPSSFEGTYGHIRYRVKAVMVTSGIFSSNKEKMVSLRVHSPIDLNVNPYCREPIEMELINSYCCWCISSGSSEIRIKMPAGGYIPGQIIPLHVAISNLSSVELDEIKFVIKRELKFEAMSRPGTRTEDYTVAKIKKGPVPGGTTPEWNLEIPVPEMDIYNFDMCKYITVTYDFKVEVSVSGCHEDDEEHQRIVFGNIPLVGFQDNIDHPYKNRQPHTIQGGNFYPGPPIITQQPNYQQNTAYPGSQSYPGNQPYPGSQPYTYPGNQPYPIPGNQPYPIPGNQPYPNPGQPFPNPAQPFPNPGNQPYYQGNQPYPPPENQPYPPPGNQPYPPPGNQPYPPPGNQPYPIVTPITGPQYPPGNLPQPSLVPDPDPAPPYPGPVLNTGNAESFGFVMNSDQVKAPLLPPGSNAPYPTDPHSKPDAAPSAPKL